MKMQRVSSLDGWKALMAITDNRKAIEVAADTKHTCNPEVISFLQLMGQGKKNKSTYDQFVAKDAKYLVNFEHPGQEEVRKEFRTKDGGWDYESRNGWEKATHSAIEVFNDNVLDKANELLSKSKS